LRTTRSNNGTLVQPANAVAETAPAQITLAFDDNRLASLLLGQYGQNLALIERRLGVGADQRGNHVTIVGSRDACEQARRVLEGLYERLKRGDELVSGDVEGTIRLAIAQGSLFDFDPAGARPSFEEINLRKRPVRAQTAAQDGYIRALKRHALVFGTGPAGTGKTWLAVARAVQLFERKEIDRIILSRPAVEAGERLGFLPGDMREKVDPYLRPLYDALYDLCDPEKVDKMLEKNIIEVAPLAFMRGRTLSDAFIIMDEAQNTTTEQMKMFLTRLGANSKAVITGDITQIDLPNPKKSGLVEAINLLEGVEGIKFCHFEDVDVVRHSLVQRIIRAYEGKSQQRELPLGMGDGPESQASQGPRILVKPSSKPQ
jgi:phosphate starvation-inducible protein PhoH and related proteins